MSWNKFFNCPTPPHPLPKEVQLWNECAFQQQGDSKQVDAFSCILEKPKRCTSVFSLFTTTKHSWKNALFFSVAVLFFFQRTRKYRFFPFCCENWHRRWMNRYPVSLRCSQTCLYFNGISRYFEANFELLVVCYFFEWVFVCAFSNYATKIFTSWQIGDIENEVEEFWIAEYLWCPRVPESQSV